MARASAGAGLEERLAQRWLVWLGGVTLALGGILLVKLAADQGLFGPGVRLSLAGLGGLLLVWLGERVRERAGGTGSGGDSRPVPSALAAAGLADLFAVVWAAFALYGFIPGAVAFAALALLALGALVMSLRHGRFLALLGLVGGLAVPALVGAAEPEAAPLFGYLLILTAAAILVLHTRPWPELGALAVLGMAGWSVVWVLSGWQPGDGALLVAGLLAAPLLLMAWPPAFSSPRPWFDLPVIAGLVVTPPLLLTLGRDGFGALAMATFLAGALVAMILARRRQAVAGAAWPPAVAFILALAFYDLGAVAWFADGVVIPPADAFLFETGWRRPARTPAFILWCAAAAAGWESGALVLSLGARRSGVFAGLSAIVPLSALAVAYARLADFVAIEPVWPALAAGLAGFGLAACALAHRRGLGDAAVGAHAVGVVGALGLGFAMILEQGWLVVALAAMLPALIAIGRRLALKPLLRIAAWLTPLPVALAVLTPETAGLAEIGRSVPLLWIGHALGLPIAACLLAVRLLERRFHGLARLAILLESAAFLFWLLLIAQTARRLAVGIEGGALFEAGLEATLWLATSLALFRRRGGRGLAGGAAWVLLAAALLVLVAGPLTRLNPLLTGEPVGAWPLLNLLLPGFGLPALVLALLARTLPRLGWPGLAQAVGGAALLLLLVWAGLELRRAFLGPVIDGPMTALELHAHSLLLVALGAALLLAGILREGPGRGGLGLRRAGLAVLLFATLKVFLVDLRGLEGVTRAASFIGLGLALIAIGHASQRWAGRARPAAGGLSGEVDGA